jgi:squalene synthase HpnC
MVKRYTTHEQLLGYCRNSANPVGRLVLYLCESYTETNAALSDHVCTALQLANFWQDVARDFAIGRVYLPQEDRLRFGYSEADLQNKLTNPAFRALMRYEVEQTRDMFYRGWPLLDRIDPEIKPDIELFIRGGLGILKKIEKIDFDVWTTRPELAKWEKLLLLGGVLWQRLQGSFLAGPHKPIAPTLRELNAPTAGSLESA